jgi:hypothetical protein
VQALNTKPSDGSRANRRRLPPLDSEVIDSGLSNPVDLHLADRETSRPSAGVGTLNDIALKYGSVHREEPLVRLDDRLYLESLLVLSAFVLDDLYLLATETVDEAHRLTLTQGRP